MILNCNLTHRSTALSAAFVMSLLCVTLPSAVYAQDKLSKDVLIQLSRDQSTVLCKSEKFTQCMDFSEARCLELSEKAVQMCLAPLPDTINLAELENEAIEACPKDVYDKAGYTDEKAQQCLQEAMK